MIDVTASIGFALGSTFCSTFSIISVKKFASEPLLPSLPTFVDSLRSCLALPVGSTRAEIVNKCFQIIVAVSWSAEVKIIFISI